MVDTSGRWDRLMVALALLTAVTGLVDAVSYLALGRVFVANMTGNVVFLAFAVAGAGGLSAPKSLAAGAAFLGGALLGGRLANRYAGPRRRWLGAAFGLEVVLLAAATVVAAVSEAAAPYVLICLLAGGLGLQNATVRKLGSRT